MRYFPIVFIAMFLFTSCKEEKKPKAVYDETQRADEPKGPAVSENTGTQIGDIAPDIALQDTSGNIVKLSSLRGKYVLVDFWASWCRPCRREIPHVKEAYDSFKDKGFEIYGVSLDANKEDWVRAIQNWGMNWVHVSDLAYWSSSVVPQYRLSGIPATFLLDKEGKIIAKNLRGPQLHLKLQQVLGGKVN